MVMKPRSAIVLGIEARRLFLHGAVTREIPASCHRLFTHNTLMWKTQLFAIAPGEHVAFQVINRAGFGTYWMLALPGTGHLYLSVERERNGLLPCAFYLDAAGVVFRLKAEATGSRSAPRAPRPDAIRTAVPPPARSASRVWRAGSTPRGRREPEAPLPWQK